MRRALGASLLALPFVAVFVTTSALIGWPYALLAFALAAALVCCIVAGVELLMGR